MVVPPTPTLTITTLQTLTRPLIGCGIQARRAQEGRGGGQCGSSGAADVPIRDQGCLRDDQEEGGGSLGSDADQQDLERGHQRQPEEALREWRNLRASPCPHRPRATSTQRARARPQQLTEE